MIIDKQLIGEKIILRQIELKDCTSDYVCWLNDEEVNQYLETRWSEQNLETIKEFVGMQRGNSHSILLAIVVKDTNQHIGNIKIGPISRYHHADISYFIGEKSYWGKGIITEAIGLICQFGFDELGLHRIEAGAYEAAIGSWKALEKNGFKREGILRDAVMWKSQYMNIFKYGLLEAE